MKIERVLVQAITVSLGHRKVDPAIVDSLKRLGMLSPIIVRVITEDNIHLIAGRHRLEAAKRLGWGMIDAYCFTGDDTEARMREIAENLHRSELTALERAEQIEEWRTLCEDQAKVVQLVHPGGRQPTDHGVSRAARELGVSRPEIKRAEKIASMTPAAKEAAKEAGIDDNQSKLLKVAAAEPEKQVAAVEQAAKKSARKTAKPAAKPDDVGSDEKRDYSAFGEPKDVTDAGRKRGLMWRAAEAVRLARFDDLAGLEVDEEMRKVVKDAADAWAELQVALAEREASAASAEVVETTRDESEPADCDGELVT